MDSAQLFVKFHRGIGWNGILYIIYKSLSTLITFFLFRTLTTHDFSLWANSMSIIFLILLWADCGLRKSLPRFSPEFARYKNGTKLFTSALIIFQGILLLLTLPVCLYIVAHLSDHLNLHYPLLLYWIAVLFVSEGLVLLMQLIYHSYFWHKQFNILYMSVLLLETVITLLCIVFISSSAQLLQTIFAIKIVSRWVVNGASIILLPRLYKDPAYNGTHEGSLATTSKSFIKHSSIMWINTILKSLTERNFLLPLLTYTLGPVSANLFKLASDSALLLYRPIVKTIGTTDTSFLAHITMQPNGKELLPYALAKLIRQIVLLCLPLIVVVGILFSVRDMLFSNPFVFNLFLILAIGYFIEALLSPFERVLEVQSKYKSLLFAYLPYIFTLIAFGLGNLLPSLGLISSLLIIHSSRALGSCLMAYSAYRSHDTLS